MRNMTFFSASALVGWLALWPASGRAGECSVECASPCANSCSVDAPGCSAICFGGACPGFVHCEVFGPDPCDYFIELPCVKPSSQRDSAAEGGPAWAVLEYWTDGRTLVEPTEMTPLAFSSEVFAEEAAIALAERVNERILAAARSSAAPSRRRTVLVVEGRGESATRIALQFRARDLPERFAIGAKGYVRVRTRDGRVVDVELLYGTDASFAAFLPSFLWETLSVSGGARRSADVFAVIGVHEGHRLGYAATARGRAK